MIEIIQKKHIEYSINDTFSLPVYPAYEGYFSEGAQLTFIIAKNEQEEHLIEKNFNIREDSTFLIFLDENDKKKLEIGDYIYKLKLLKDNEIVTEKSGDFIVKWGA